MPKGFFPQQDNGTVFGGIQAAQDISFQAMQGLTLRFVDIIKSDPAVQNAVHSPAAVAQLTRGLCIWH